jgi:hypothetical protein
MSAFREWKIGLRDRYGREAERVTLAESGMSRFEMETVETCRSLGIVPADLFRPVPLVLIRPACARSAHRAE